MQTRGPSKPSPGRLHQWSDRVTSSGRETGLDQSMQRRSARQSALARPEGLIHSAPGLTGRFENLSRLDPRPSAGPPIIPLRPVPDLPPGQVRNGRAVSYVPVPGQESC